MKADDLGRGWSKFTVLDPETQIFYNRYFYKRVKAYRVVIDTPKARTLAAYTLIEKDLRSTMVWLNEIKELLASDKVTAGKSGSQKTTHDRTRYNIIKGLFVASLTFYAKCFATCEGRKVKLEKRNLSEEYQKYHDDIMETRHNFAAHSGAKKIERVHIVMALDSKRRKGAVPYITRELGQPDSFSPKCTEDFIALVTHVKEFVDKKIVIMNDKLLKDDILTKTPDDWYKEIEK